MKPFYPTVDTTVRWPIPPQVFTNCTRRVRALSDTGLGIRDYWQTTVALPWRSQRGVVVGYLTDGSATVIEPAMRLSGLEPFKLAS